MNKNEREFLAHLAILVADRISQTIANCRPNSDDYYYERFSSEQLFELASEIVKDFETIESQQEGVMK